MKTLGLSGALAFAVVLAGCGSSGDSSSDGGKGGSTGGGGQSGKGGSTGGGGQSGKGGSTDGGGAGGSSTGCDAVAPACLTDLLNACTPSGTCVEQTDPTTFGVNTCFSNGVKTFTTINSTFTGGTLRYTKPDGSPCFSETFTVDANGNGTFTLMNASGATVASGTSDANGNATFTCGGRTYVPCDDNGDGGASATCTQGTCQ